MPPPPAPQRPTPGADALTGLRVLELGALDLGSSGPGAGHDRGGLAAAYATRLLVDLGADVCTVEPPSGHPLRDEPGRFAYLNGAKRSAAVDLTTPAGHGWLVDAAAHADVVVEQLGAGGLEALDVGPDVLVSSRASGSPRLALVRIADFGQTGPLAGVPTTGLTLQATGGWVSAHGLVGQAPVQVGGAIHQYTAGTFAAAAALTAVRSARGQIDATPGPVTADLSIQECLVGTLAYPNLVMDDLLGAGLPPPTARHFPLPGIVRCRDGWVGINALTGQHFLDACVMLEVEDLGPRQQELANGEPVLEEFFARIQPWLDARDAQEIVELSQAFRVPAAPVGDGPMMLDYAQFRERTFFVSPEPGELRVDSTREVLLPGPPYRLSATPARRRGPGPALGDVAPAPVPGPTRTPAPPGTPQESGLPFAGLRVLDLGTFWAGPYCTMYLGAFGAEVIKVESTRRPDGFRFSGAVPEMGEDWYERGGIFAATNLDKREVTLELSTDAGRALFLRLVEDADIVLENFSARVVEQFDLGYDALRAVKPDVIMVRMPGFGLEGPWRDYVGWAMVIEQATGMAAMTGPPDRPMHPGGLADPVIGMHAAVAVQAALAHRDRTGEGQMIEVAQLETGVNLTAELVIAASGPVPSAPGVPDPGRSAAPASRLGNRHPVWAPQGVYPCRAATPVPEVVALSIVDDEQWKVLAAAIGRSDLLADASLATAAGRRAAHDVLDEGIAAWTAERSPDEVVAALRPAGVAVAPVLTVPRMYSDSQLVARGYYQELPHARTGTRRYPGWPAQFSFTPALPGGGAEHHRSGSPTLGQHNEEILRDLLGLSADEIGTLEADGIIGTRMQPPG